MVLVPSCCRASINVAPAGRSPPLPLGGYVKFLGDSNAASGKDGEAIEQLSAAERRHTMHGAPLWARAATVAAGPIFNFILSIVLFAGLIYHNGITDRAVVGAIKPTPFGEQVLQPGDQILAIDGKPVTDFLNFNEIAQDLPVKESFEYRLLRNGSEIAIPGPYPIPPIVELVNPLSAATDAGLQPGDAIVAVDGVKITAFNELRDMVKGSDGKPVLLTIWRDGATFDAALVPRRTDLPTEDGFETRWLIGLTGGVVFEPALVTPSIPETFKLGALRTWDIGVTNLSFIWHVVAGKVSSCGVSGPIGIAKVSGAAATQGSGTFILLIAALSTSVGLLNLFPVPMLDGGHLLFHAYEAVARKPPSDTALRIMMTIGLALLLSLMVFALSNDLFC